MPQHTPDPSSPTGCDCGKPDCTKPGKHPRTKRGSLDATTNQATIERWHSTWPHANLGTALEMAGLTIIGPDSPEWAAEFGRRGLPPTAVARSGGGAGHVHFYYRRRPCCPQARICKSGEYDILAKGNAILPPSLHASGERYEWLVPIESVEQLPYAPEWLCAELHPLAERESRTLRGSDADGPPVLLDDYGLRIWSGELPKLKPTGEVDRSGTLLKIGRELYDAGAAPRLIVAELAERDTTLGYRKYTDRRDAAEQYRAIVDELERQGRTPRLVGAIPPSPNGHANGVATTVKSGGDGAQTCLGCQARDDQLAQQAAFVEQLQTISRGLRLELDGFKAVMANGGLSKATAKTAIAMALVIDRRTDPETGWTRTSRAELAQIAGVGTSTITRETDALSEGESAIYEKWITRETIVGEDGQPATVSALNIRSRVGGGAETLHAVARIERTKPRHGGAREIGCRHHPTADVFLTKTWTCAECGLVLDHQRGILNCQVSTSDLPESSHTVGEVKGAHDGTSENGRADDGDSRRSLRAPAVPIAANGNGASALATAPPSPEHPAPARLQDQVDALIARHNAPELRAPAPITDRWRCAFCPGTRREPDRWGWRCGECRREASAPESGGAP